MTLRDSPASDFALVQLVASSAIHTFEEVCVAADIFTLVQSKGSISARAPVHTQCKWRQIAEWNAKVDSDTDLLAVWCAFGRLGTQQAALHCCRHLLPARHVATTCIEQYVRLSQVLRTWLSSTG